jgi:hypothetical protein
MDISSFTVAFTANYTSEFRELFEPSVYIFIRTVFENGAVKCWRAIPSDPY